MTIDYDAIRTRIESLCKLPVTFGLPVPEAGFMPRKGGSRDGQSVTMRYVVPVTVGGFTTNYTYPVTGKAYTNSAFHSRGVDMGHGWVAVPPRDRLPKVGDVLSCLLHDGQAGSDTFADFCADFGYDEDSRKAFEIYLACQKCLDAVRLAFGADLAAACELSYQL
jgi:hypothetical protein